MGFLDNNGPKGFIQLHITSNETGSCLVHIRFLKINESITISSVKLTTYNISRDIDMNTTGIENKTVVVLCNVPVSIYTMNYYPAYTEGYLAIPYHGLGQRYVAATYSTVTNDSLILNNLSIGVISTRFNTTVTVFLKIKKGFINYGGKTFVSNDTFSVKLSTNQTFYLTTHQDLTGTVITSTNPVAVVSGGYIHINKSCQYTGYTTEMILPHEQLAKNFIIPRLYNSRCKYRVLSDADSNVTIYDSTIGIKILAKGKFFEVSNFTIATVQSLSGVLVQMYCYEINHSLNTAMITLPGLQHFKSEYIFVVASNFPGDNFPPDNYYITIIIETNAISGIKLDNIIGPFYNYTSDITIEGKAYSILSYGLIVGIHEIIQVNGVPFGLIVYGRNPLDGYGYPAGYNFVSK